ncbi:DedA family protein [Azospirillum agricola]|uniref:DedA family protein n=1 Tax=Azospirillum agricola TaxID=1720247 RepID=UPI000A0F0511|nr:DedA family protein [Azospirillum agricola]SMH44781.1 membrane protein DedA, SNARE-associated domain [Azospirillum lipoferum]
MPIAFPDFKAQATALASFIETHAEWAGAIIFLVAFTEGITIVGLLVPGVVMLTAAGALVAAGILDFWTVYLAIVGGAVLGDAASYWLGRLYGERLFQLWPFSRRPELRDRGEAFFLRHGGKSVFLARFVGPLRAVVPTTAGMMAMPHRQFQTFNLLSAAIWAPLLMSPGHLAWTGYDLSSLGNRNAPAAGSAESAPGLCRVAPPVAGSPRNPAC